MTSSGKAWLSGVMGKKPSRNKGKPRRNRRLKTESLERRRLLAVTVTTVADTVDPDDGVYSLRERLNDHAADDPTTPLTIDFDDNITSIQLESDELLISSNVHIAGPGHDTLEIIAAPGQRVFAVNSSADATISGLSVTGGDTESYGGGIAMDGGTLELNRVRVHNNIARINGLSIHAGGGIQVNNGTLNVIDSTIDQNQAFSGAGVMSYNSVVTIEGSTIANNFTTGIAESSTANLGGGIATAGEPTDQITIRNTTISGNTAGHGGGIAIRRGPAELVNVTITENEVDVEGAGVAGGILALATSTFELHNSIVVGNRSSSSAHANARIYPGTSHTDSYNLFGPGADGFRDGDGNQTAVPDAGLFPLGDYGGPTQTHALSRDSIAIDAGDNRVASDAGLLFDQRGTGFDRVAGLQVDIGAVERGENPPDVAALTVSGRLSGRRQSFGVCCSTGRGRNGWIHPGYHTYR